MFPRFSARVPDEVRVHAPPLLRKDISQALVLRVMVFTIPSLRTVFASKPSFFLEFRRLAVLFLTSNSGNLLEALTRTILESDLVADLITLARLMIRVCMPVATLKTSAESFVLPARTNASTTASIYVRSLVRRPP